MIAERYCYTCGAALILEGGMHWLCPNGCARQRPNPLDALHRPRCAHCGHGPLFHYDEGQAVPCYYSSDVRYPCGCPGYEPDE